MTPTIPITMRADELGRMISQYIEVGYSMAVKRFEPKADLLRKAEVEQWLFGRELDIFHKLVKAERIVAHKKGYGKNSPLFYSKSEILTQLALYPLDAIGADLVLKQK